MDAAPGPKEIRGAAAVASSLSYVVGLAGIVVGGLLLRDGDTTMAIVVWVLAFAAGAALMVAALVVRAIGDVQARLSLMESDLRVILADRNGTAPTARGGEGGQWGHQPPW